MDGLHISGRVRDRPAAGHHRARRARAPPGRHTPRHEWRGLHVDLARQFLPAADVELVDRRRRMARSQPVASAPDRRRGLARAGRRLPGAHRGRRVARSRTADPGAARFRQRAVRRRLHARADRRVGQGRRRGRRRRRAGGRPAGALLRRPRRVPELADPDDTSGAVSVQWFVDNVLNPGVPGWRPFVEAVVRLARRPVPVAVAARRRRRAAGRRSPSQRTPPSGLSFLRAIVETEIVVDHRAGRSACGRRPPKPVRCIPTTATSSAGSRPPTAGASPRMGSRSSPRPPRCTTSTWPPTPSGTRRG